MPRFTKASLDKLRNSIDLFEVISAYIPMKRAGSLYKALCPFHDEKTASFTLQRGDTHYHCYGCGAHGDAISFLMEHQKMGFLEAVESLAEKFQVILETDGEDVKTISKVTLKDLLSKAVRFYHFFLLHTEEGKEALLYLYKRGMDLDFIKTFQIGLAPKEERALLKFMKEGGVDLRTLEETGLSKGENDFFRDRITIPILDAAGSFIGFSARKFKEETFGPKYINTPETLLFKKSKVLFGLNYCRKKIAKERRAIIVEGQFDALRLIYAGFAITVAGQGTAFGDDQVKELLNLGVNRVYLAFDSDEAGEEATLKVGNLFQREGIEVFVVKMEDKDPDSTVLERGPNYFVTLLKQSVDYLQFMVDKFSKVSNVKTPAGKNELVLNIARRIKEWKYPLMVHESLKKLAALTNSFDAILNLYDRKEEVQKRGILSFEEINPDEILEMDLLRLLFLEKKFLDVASKNLNEKYFKVEACKNLYLKFMQVEDFLALGSILSDEESKLLSVVMQRKINREKREELLTATLQKVLDREWMLEREEIKLKINSKNCSDEEAFVLAQEFDRIKKNRPKIVL